MVFLRAILKILVFFHLKTPPFLSFFHLFLGGLFRFYILFFLGERFFEFQFTGEEFGAACFSHLEREF